MRGLTTRPGTEVEPMCSIRNAFSRRPARIPRACCSKRAGHCGRLFQFSSCRRTCEVLRLSSGSVRIFFRTVSSAGRTKVARRRV